MINEYIAEYMRKLKEQDYLTPHIFLVGADKKWDPDFAGYGSVHANPLMSEMSRTYI